MGRLGGKGDRESDNFCFLQEVYAAKSSAENKMCEQGHEGSLERENF